MAKQKPKWLKKSEILIRSWLLIKPGIEMHEICFNAKSKNCSKCQEECDYAGKKF